MKGCSSWMDAITDCALAQTPEPRLAAHLAICPQCQKALRESRAMAARIDQALDRSAAVEPPLYGPDRVMARIHSQTDTHTWWRWAAVGSAVLAVLMAIVMWVRRPALDVNVTALSTWRSPTQALLRPPLMEAWTIRPRLGEGFFRMKQAGEMRAQ